MPLIAWIAIPRRPMKMTPRYILSQSRSTSSGSSPISSSRRLFAIACEPGAVHEGRDGLGRRVDLADAGDPLVGVDQDDEVVLAAVGNALVHGGLPQDDGLDIGDLQAGLLGTMPGGAGPDCRS